MKDANQNINSISQKVLKLLALAEGNKNEHERAVAMKLAMELLARHNLDMRTLNDHYEAPALSTAPVDLRPEPWVRKVLHAVCKLYYTRFYIQKTFNHQTLKATQRAIFVGTGENIDVSMQMAVWLVNNIRQESNSLFTEAYERRSFRLGASQVIYERACALIEDEKRQEEEKANRTSSSTNSLMLIRNQLEKANDDYMASLRLGVFKARRSYFDGDAYDRGEDFGRKVDLGRDGKPKRITMRSSIEGDQ